MVNISIVCFNKMVEAKRCKIIIEVKRKSDRILKRDRDLRCLNLNWLMINVNL